MFKKTKSSSKKTFARAAGVRSHWFLGIILGQILGFTAAMFVAAPAVFSVVILTLAGGFLGGLAGAKLKSKSQKVRREEPLRKYMFEALEVANKKLTEMFVDEDFNGAASGSSRGLKQEKKAAPRLAPNTPRPGM